MGSGRLLYGGERSVLLLWVVLGGRDIAYIRE